MNDINPQYANYKINVKRLREVAENSTKVVAWYPHGQEIRGPFYRWFTVSGGYDNSGNLYPSVVEGRDDIKFACEAMNNFVPLLDRIEELEKQIEEMKKRKLPSWW